MDEIERQREREKKSRGIISVEIGKEEVPHTAVDIEIGDEDFIKVAQEAHRRDITFNKMVNIILKAKYRIIVFVDKDFLNIAQEAHARDITINKMINIILNKGITDAQYRFEHDPKPQLLNETE